MLVLTRKTREQIQLGDDITITILRVKGQTVRLGIEAPDRVKVRRSELPVRADGRRAAGGAASSAPGRSGRRRFGKTIEATRGASVSMPRDRSETLLQAPRSDLVAVVTHAV